MRIPEHKLNEIRKDFGEDKKKVEMFFNSVFLSLDAADHLGYRNRTLIEKRKNSELESKHNKLVLQHKTLLLSKKRGDIEDVVKKLNILQAEPNKKNVEDLILEISTNENIEKNWIDYLNSFEELNPTFFKNVQKLGVKLSVKEKRLCVFICQGLTIKQIATALSNKPRSIENARSRLRKKFNLQPSQNLSDYLNALSATE
jgi:DNA-binding CsgD family transcriptional regulator